MKLKKWLKDTDTKVVDFAKILGVTKQAVYKWMEGTMPRHDIMWKIITATSGSVMPLDFMRLKNEQDVRSTEELRP